MTQICFISTTSSAKIPTSICAFSRYIWYKVYISDLHYCTLCRGTEQKDLKKTEDTKD